MKKNRNRITCILAVFLLLGLALGLPLASVESDALPWQPTGDFIEISIDLEGKPLTVSYWKSLTETYGEYNWTQNNSAIRTTYNEWVTQIESGSEAALWTDTTWTAYAWTCLDPNYTSDKLIIVENVLTLNAALTAVTLAVGDLTPEWNVTLNLATLSYARGTIRLCSEMGKNTFKEITATERVSMYRDIASNYKQLLIDLANYYKLGIIPSFTKADRYMSDAAKAQAGILEYNSAELQTTKSSHPYPAYQDSVVLVRDGLDLTKRFVSDRDLNIVPGGLLLSIPLGGLSVKVLDGNGAALPDTLVTVRHSLLGLSTYKVTDETGQASFTLIPGIYEVEMEKEGYYPAKSDDRVFLLIKTNSAYNLEEESTDEKVDYWMPVIVGLCITAAIMIVMLALILKKKKGSYDSVEKKGAKKK